MEVTILKDDSTYEAGLLNPEYIRDKQKEVINLTLLRDWSKQVEQFPLQLNCKKRNEQV